MLDYTFTELTDEIRRFLCDIKTEIKEDLISEEEEDQESKVCFIAVGEDENTQTNNKNSDDKTELQKSVGNKCKFCGEIFLTMEEKQDHEKSYRDSNGELICRFEGCKAQTAS